MSRGRARVAEEWPALRLRWRPVRRSMLFLVTTLALAACAAPPVRVPVAPASAPPAPLAAPPLAAPPPPQEEGSRGARLGELLNRAGDAPSEPSGKVEAASLWASAAPVPRTRAAAPGPADRLAIARALCDGGRASARGCAKCPSYTDLDTDPLGLRMGLVHPGHFSGPGREEVVVETQGCETGASAGQSDGGGALVRRTADGWRRVHYQAGALGQCSSILSHGGRSRLVCQLRSGHMGLYSVAFVLLGFDEVDGETEEQRGLFLLLFDHVPDALRIFTHAPLGVFGREHFELRGQERYEAGDDRALSVVVSVRSTVDCEGGPTACPGIDAGPIDARLRYTFDGAAFHLAPESQPVFEQISLRNHD